EVVGRQGGAVAPSPNVDVGPTRLTGSSVEQLHVPLCRRPFRPPVPGASAGGRHVAQLLGRQDHDIHGGSLIRKARPGVILSVLLGVLLVAPAGAAAGAGPFSGPVSA